MLPPLGACHIGEGDSLMSRCTLFAKSGLFGFIGTLVALVVLPSCVRAEGFPTVESLAPADCTVSTVAAYAHMHNVERQGELAGQALPLIDEQQRIVAKAPKPGVAVGQQLSPENSAAFSENRHKLISINALQLLESNQVRDTDAVVQLTRIAVDNHKWNRRAEGASPDSVYQAALDVMRVTLPSIALPDATKNRTCSMDTALVLESLESLRKLGALDLDGAQQTLQAMSVRYNMAQLDRAKLSPADREVFDRLQRGVLLQADAEVEFLKDIERIKWVARAADLTFTSGGSDLADGGGAPMKIGNRITRQAKAGELRDEMVVALYALRQIGEKVPSEKSNEMRQVADKMRELNKKYPVKK